MTTFDEDEVIADQSAAEAIALLAQAGLTLTELRAYWRTNRNPA